MKKLKDNLRRALLMLLVMVFLAVPLGNPRARVRADGAEFELDGSAFNEPEYDTCMMYFWHKGLPSVTKDKQGNYIKYPILITWKDTYCLRTDENFKNELLETHSKQKKKNDHYKFFGISSGYVASDSFSADDYDRVWGDTDYYMRYLYDTTDSSLLSKLGLDLNSLKKYGEAVSMDASGLPFIVPTDTSKDQYAIGLDEKVFGKDYWLIGSTRNWEWVETGMFGTDNWMGGVVQWELDYEHWKSDQFLNKDYVYKGWRSMYDVNAHKSYEYTEGADQHYWTVKQDANGLYHFWTMGENLIEDWGRITGSYGRDWNRTRMRNWFHANDVARVNLYYKGAKIGASTPTVKNKDWKNRVNTVDNTDGYTVYYADPNIVSFYRNSFTVVKGQVVTLDGPCVLDNQCTVTVKDGGVLACSGWVINNGQINVEPGGMLILQDRDTATGDYQFGCISSVGVEAGSGSGRIACDGTIIVNRDCKLTCAGAYGLELGSTAQVVNYGQIIAENLSVYSNQIIENRGDTSAVFAGWGVTDSGYALSRTQITGQDYNAKGTRESIAVVAVTRDGVYGDGAARFYVNPANTVTYTQPEKQKGYVSGFTASIDGSSYVSPAELPAGIPIYTDTRYGAYYIKVGGKIYQYHSLIDRWVNIEEGGHESFYDYRMPSRSEEFTEENLPDGYILVSGIVVGQKFNEDLYYDWQANVYWLYSGVNCYYYEPALQKYIHVFDNNTYCVCPDELDPPPPYEHDFVPSSMYNSLPLSALFYQSGMTEVENPFGKPEVTVENGLFCVEVEGTKLWWMEKYRKFLPKEYTIVDGEAQGGLTETQVNWGYFDPDTDPDAKPKVQKEEDRYYIIVATGEHPGKYYWYSYASGFFLGDPMNYEGKPIKKEDVDLNGYTLP
ncbi:MAG: hypothetical protein IKP17_02135 [Oscillospiraceae bacterium]|nr:hypothetical protein [Oscillospiraceae bacterium]